MVLKHWRHVLFGHVKTTTLKGGFGGAFLFLEGAMVRIMCSLLISYGGAVLGRVGWAMTNDSNCWKFLWGY